MKRLQTIALASILITTLGSTALAGNIGGMRTDAAGNIGGMRTTTIDSTGNIGGVLTQQSTELSIFSKGNIGGMFFDLLVVMLP